MWTHNPPCHLSFTPAFLFLDVPPPFPVTQTVTCIGIGSTLFKHTHSQFGVSPYAEAFKLTEPVSVCKGRSHDLTPYLPLGELDI